MKRHIKKFLRAIGYDFVRYYPGSSIECFTIGLMKKHEIDLVLDVGANEGQYGAFLRRNGYSKKIASFEPLSIAYIKLLKVSKKYPDWEIAERMAIGDHNGTVKINVSQNLVSSSILPILRKHTDVEPTSQYMQTEEIKLRTLDSLADEYRILDSHSILLKIDTQGYEDKILSGAAQLLTKIAMIQLELSLTPLYQGQKLLVDVVRSLEEKGFQLVGLFPGFTDNKNIQMLQVEGVFLRS
jgi:FkbM family methyltransferase